MRPRALPGLCSLPPGPAHRLATPPGWPRPQAGHAPRLATPTRRSCPQAGSYTQAGPAHRLATPTGWPRPRHATPTGQLLYTDRPRPRVDHAHQEATPIGRPAHRLATPTCRAPPTGKVGLCRQWLDALRLPRGRKALLSPAHARAMQSWELRPRPAAASTSWSEQVPEQPSRPGTRIPPSRAVLSRLQASPQARPARRGRTR